MRNYYKPSDTGYESCHSCGEIKTVTHIGESLEGGNLDYEKRYVFICADCAAAVADMMSPLRTPPLRKVVDSEKFVVSQYPRHYEFSDKVGSWRSWWIPASWLEKPENVKWETARAHFERQEYRSYAIANDLPFEEDDASRDNPWYLFADQESQLI